MRRGEFLQFLHFAVSEQRGGIDGGSDLKDFSHNLSAGAGSQLREFAKRFLRGARRRTAAAFKAREDCLFRVPFEGNRRFNARRFSPR